MLAEVGEECAFLAERRHLCKGIQAEVSPLELSFTEIAPLGKDDVLAVCHAHRQRVTMHEVLRQHVISSWVEIIRLIDIQVVGKGLQHIGATLGDIVFQKLNSVAAHDSQ